MVNKEALDGYERISFDDHYPVMWRNILDLIETDLVDYRNIGGKEFVVGDFTLGCGNHTKLILDKFSNSTVIGMDLDPKMIDLSYNKLEDYINENRLTLIEDSYVGVDNVNISEFFPDKFKEKKKFDFILLDLGYNSMQLEDREKGISFKHPDCPLDMRYDPANENKSKACDILNHASELELYEIFHKFAEEKNYERITKQIVRQRDTKRFETVGDFLAVIDESFSNKTNDKFNTYTRLFQALRITVNYEMMNLQRFMGKVIGNLEPNAILAVITFHSIEDRYAKTIMNQWESVGLGTSVFKHGVKSGDAEKEENSRSRSAILRAFRFCPNKNYI